jgi:prepilin-type N-terminal cleavage/methylation domain-containing protein
VRKCRTGFSLVELLIVMGIIVLLIAMAIPSVRVLTGTRSMSVAQNQLAAVITRAREDAIALQDIRGVLFYIDPTTGRVGAVIVQQAVMTDTTNIIFNTVLLDTLPGNDSLLFPPAVGLQTIINGMDPTPTGYLAMMSNPTTTNATHVWHVNAANRAQMSATQQDDRYLGFSPVPGGNYHQSVVPFLVGGCILFDGSGRLIVRPYAFQMSTFNSSGVVPSNLCKLMGFDVDMSGNSTFATMNPTYINPPTHTGSLVIIPGGLPYPAFSSMFPKVPLLSQVGLILFDHDAFQSLGFTDADADIQGVGYTTPWPINGTGGVNGDGIHSEFDEENWLDVNSTPITINRVNGTLIRGE